MLEIITMPRSRNLSGHEDAVYDKEALEIISEADEKFVAWKPREDEDVWWWNGLRTVPGQWHFTEAGKAVYFVGWEAETPIFRESADGVALCGHGYVEGNCDYPECNTASALANLRDADAPGRAASRVFRT